MVIVASDTEGRFICVRQFRQGIKEVTTEFPAGGLERKDGKEYDFPYEEHCSRKRKIRPSGERRLAADTFYQVREIK